MENINVKYGNSNIRAKKKKRRRFMRALNFKSLKKYVHIFFYSSKIMRGVSNTSLFSPNNTIKQIKK